jgi:hypothetical protein
MMRALVLNQVHVNSKVFHLPTILRDAICKYVEKQCLFVFASESKLWLITKGITTF